MKKITLFTLLLIVLSLFSSCEEPKELIITDNVLLGKWLIKDRVGGLSTDCERNEYIIFYEDGSLFRQQCGTSSGTWRVENEELFVDLGLDSIYAGTEYKCELIAEDELKAKLVGNSLVWITYKKEALQ